MIIAFLLGGVSTGSSRNTGLSYTFMAKPSNWSLSGERVKHPCGAFGPGAEFHPASVFIPFRPHRTLPDGAGPVLRYSGARCALH